MATTKKAVKFYAEPSIEEHLETIPPQLRSNWINRVIGEAIEREKSKAAGGGSELAQLGQWLNENREAAPLYDALADMLDQFAESKR